MGKRYILVEENNGGDEFLGCLLLGALGLGLGIAIVAVVGGVVVWAVSLPITAGLVGWGAICLSIYQYAPFGILELVTVIYALSKSIKKHSAQVWNKRNKENVIMFWLEMMGRTILRLLGNQTMVFVIQVAYALIYYAITGADIPYSGAGTFGTGGDAEYLLCMALPAISCPVIPVSVLSFIYYRKGGPSKSAAAPTSSASFPKFGRSKTKKSSDSSAVSDTGICPRCGGLTKNGICPYCGTRS